MSITARQQIQVVKVNGEVRYDLPNNTHHFIVKNKTPKNLIRMAHFSKDGTTYTNFKNTMSQVECQGSGHLVFRGEGFIEIIINIV